MRTIVTLKPLESKCIAGATHNHTRCTRKVEFGDTICVLNVIVNETKSVSVSLVVQLGFRIWRRCDFASLILPAV